MNGDWLAATSPLADFACIGSQCESVAIVGRHANSADVSFM